ncbi:MAG: tRNA pseudouridine(38-40) synthase TruA, partial [Bryobacteraceae bacterium]
MRRLRFEVAYDGTDFNGWQVQPGLPSIQGTLEQAIGAIEKRPVHVAASGRTDAGVHALAQVAAVTIENPIPVDNFRRAVNRLLPPCIRVSRARETALEFHPRFDARRMRFEYR